MSCGQDIKKGLPHSESTYFIDTQLFYNVLDPSYKIEFVPGGRNRRVAEAFAKTGRSIKELEDEMLNGQKLQGPITAEEVNHMLANKNMENK